MVVAAAHLYLKGLDILNTHDPHNPSNDISLLVKFFGTKLSDWLSSPKVFSPVFDSASRSQKETKVGQATLPMCGPDIELFQVWEDLLEYDVCYGVKQCWHSKAEEIIRLRVDKVQLYT